MLSRLLCAVFTVLCLLLAGPCGAAETTEGLDEQTLQAVHKLVERRMSQQGIPGLSVAIGLDNQLKFAHGYGQADLENAVQTQALTVYRTASIAKPMTAVAVLRLVEDGKVDLDAPVQKYCSLFPEKRWRLTCRHLLGHLGGVRHYQRPFEASGTRHFESVTDSLSLFADDPLLQEPGTKFAYTTYGYNLLGAVMEGAAEGDFLKQLQVSVLQPAKMQHTRGDDHYAIIPNRARGYANRIFRGLQNASLHDTSMKIPGGGLVSTAPDLVRFATALNTGRLLKPETLQLVWTAQQTKSGKRTSYGLGWTIGEQAGAKVVSHGGGQAGTATYLILLPDSGTCIALMCNLQGAKLKPLAGELIRAVTQRPVAAEPKSGKAAEATGARK